MIILTGLDEATWYNNIINDIKKIGDTLLSKLDLTFYMPFDYIPHNINDLKKNSSVITTIPFNDLYTVGHAIDPIFKYINIDRIELIKLVNNKFGTNLQGDEILILNANSNTPRKRIQLTINSFNKLVNKIKSKLILWLHSSNYDNLINVPKNCIFTKQLSSEDLNIIYNVCQIGLQTSSGEGWSLTNCEHAMCGGLQVVPNFLATGHHFDNGRGILIKTSTVKLDKKTYCTLSEDDISDSLIEAIILLSLNRNYFSKCVEYFSGYNWKNETTKLGIYLNKNSSSILN